MMPKIPATKPAASSTTAPTPGQYVTVREAARLLKLSEISIRRFLTQKKLRRFKIGSRTLILHAELIGLIREAE